VAEADIIARSAAARVVLLGEDHDNAAHHRWQLATLTLLAARRPRMVMGLEMFPRRVQPALDRWVAGTLSEDEFLSATDWRKVWGYDAAQYLPLFRFALANHIPMLALNVERELVRMVAAGGLAAVPAEQREGVSDPAPAAPGYIDWLFAMHGEHAGAKAAVSREDPAFRRFVEAQLLWDRAMAQALAGAAARDPQALIVGIMGSGHIRQGYGVPHQLRDLGMSQLVTLLPVDPGAQCGDVVEGLATAVFGAVNAPGTAAGVP
jgi:uncharacterized iron-regulated protein